MGWFAPVSWDGIVLVAACRMLWGHLSSGRVEWDSKETREGVS